MMWTDVSAELGVVPREALTYLAHTETGASIRALARDAGCHASTILRQVRQVESRRDDPLIDQALSAAAVSAPQVLRRFGGTPEMSEHTIADARAAGKQAPSGALAEETFRILGRMAEAGAVMALATNMENAVVLREMAQGDPVRTAIVPRAIAEAMAMQDWIRVVGEGRIRRYAITAAGRAALKAAARRSDGTGASPETSDTADPGPSDGGRRGRMRYGAAESPLIALSRRRDKDGRPFLADNLVRAGERLREDFELAQMGPRVAQDWDRFLTGGAGDMRQGRAPHGTGPADARARVQSVLADLGPGLGDVVLRACCYLEGMEAIEKRMGWAARSGKIVLRIGPERLLRHYDERHGGAPPMIG